MRENEIPFACSLLGQPLIIRCDASVGNELLILLHQHSAEWCSGHRLIGDGDTAITVDNDHCWYIRVTDKLLVSYGSRKCYETGYGRYLRTYYDPTQINPIDVDDLL